jgi:glycosyltransferase involved in cell wall biosynthesis
MNRPRVLIVAEHASAQFGGEAALPLHYFRVLRRRGYDVWLITHARTRDELSRLYPDEKRIIYIEDTKLHRAMWHIGRRLPGQIPYFTTAFVSRLDAQLKQRSIARRLVSEHGIDVIHQPMPVSPREPSLIHGLGVPVIIGPMNGGMDYPLAFRRHRGLIERVLLHTARGFSSLLNRLMPGKRRAALLLVANRRTRAALPASVCPRVVELVENGVDLSLWNPAAHGIAPADGLTTFVFVGRLVDWKAVDILLHAFRRASSQLPMRLRVLGDGPERAGLEALAAKLEILSLVQDSPTGVYFAGWMSQKECASELQRADCLVLPSLLECGGAVVLEAMSMAKPVVATAWGGPEDYIDEQCGILVPPIDRESLIQGFADSMIRLASSQALRLRLGESGRKKVAQQYDWEVKVDRILELYDEARASKLENR